MSVVGVAYARAQGHAITSVATNAKIANVRTERLRLIQGRRGLAHPATVDITPGKAIHRMKVEMAIVKTTGTKYPVTLSANS